MLDLFCVGDDRQDGAVDELGQADDAPDALGGGCAISQALQGHAVLGHANGARLQLHHERGARRLGIPHRLHEDERGPHALHAQLGGRPCHCHGCKRAGAALYWVSEKLAAGLSRWLNLAILVLAEPVLAT